MEPTGKFSIHPDVSKKMLKKQPKKARKLNVFK